MVKESEHLRSNEWEIVREEEITRYDQKLDYAVATSFVTHLSYLLRENLGVQTILAKEDANFVETIKAKRISPQQEVGRELTLGVADSATNAFGVFRQYSEAAMMDIRQVIAEINFGAISPDRTEQVSVLYVLSMHTSGPLLYTDKAIWISRNSEFSKELVDLCILFEEDKTHDPNRDLRAITATIDRVRRWGYLSRL